MKQGTDEWFQARLGKVTASRLIDIMPGPRGYRASRKNYRAEKVCEILTGKPQESFTTAAIEWGTEQEPIARAAYEAKTKTWVDEVGFIEHPGISGFGASPDGLIANNGCIEIKCPNTATAIDFITTGNIKQDYIYQMQGVMMCTGMVFCDFVVFDPRLPEHLQLTIKRVETEPEIQAKIKVEVEKFRNELNALIDSLKKEDEAIT